ncbi:MAG: hypothetical protein ACRET3_02435 [Burkholderiales bacterium]
MLTEHTDTLEGLLTHVARADCMMMLPHRALECGIVAAWWRQVETGPPVQPPLEDAHP